MLTLAVDWVEERAERERLLNEGIPRIWAYLCCSLEHATASYNKHFSRATGLTAHFGRQFDDVVHVTLRGDSGPRTKGATIRLHDNTVIAEYQGGSPEAFTFGIPDKAVTLLNASDKPISEEDACRAILEPLLFPD